MIELLLFAREELGLSDKDIVVLGAIQAADGDPELAAKLAGYSRRIPDENYISRNLVESSGGRLSAAPALKQAAAVYSAGGSVILAEKQSTLFGSAQNKIRGFNDEETAIADIIRKVGKTEPLKTDIRRVTPLLLSKYTLREIEECAQWVENHWAEKYRGVPRPGYAVLSAGKILEQMPSWAAAVGSKDDNLIDKL